jgi:hypothetical protein
MFSLCSICIASRCRAKSFAHINTRYVGYIIDNTYKIMEKSDWLAGIDRNYWTDEQFPGCLGHRSCQLCSMAQAI